MGTGSWELGPGNGEACGCCAKSARRVFPPQLVIAHNLRSPALVTRKGILLLAALVIPGRAVQAQWRTEHTALAVASTATITADWLLSVDAVRRGNFNEMNPMLGTRPSVGRLNTYAFAVAAGNLAIGRMLPSRLRTLWFTAITGFESAIVLHQVNIGLHLDVGGI